MKVAEVYLTEEGKKEQEELLAYLKTVKRQEVSEHLKAAREYGDLSENSEYDAARAEQGRLESKIVLIEETLRTAKIIKDNKKKKGEIIVGSTVTIYDPEFDEKNTYKLVGTLESNPDNGLISNESPIGKALIGHKEGEEVAVSTPDGGSFTVKILEVK
ncbi:MAG: transcription elongation factor GreA [Clostridia bacterium]|nr:transcription elongation factor GreA [Clostridia bacterium]